MKPAYKQEKKMKPLSWHRFMLKNLRHAIDAKVIQKFKLQSEIEKMYQLLWFRERQLAQAEKHQKTHYNGDRYLVRRKKK